MGTASAHKARESEACIQAFHQLIKMRPHFNNVLGHDAVRQVLRKFPKATCVRTSEHNIYALEDLDKMMAAAPAPAQSGGENINPIIFNHVPRRDFTPAKAWHDEIQVGDEIMQHGQWRRIARRDRDNTGPFLIWFDPTQKFGSMGRKAGEDRIRPWHVRRARRDGVEFDEKTPLLPPAAPVSVSVSVATAAPAPLLLPAVTLTRQINEAAALACKL